MGAKPCAPVCLSASPSWAPQGTRDREGQTQGEREERERRETDTEGERKRSQGAGVKNALQRKQSSETSPLFALFSADPHGVEERSTNVKAAIRFQQVYLQIKKTIYRFR